MYGQCFEMTIILEKTDVPGQYTACECYQLWDGWLAAHGWESLLPSPTPRRDHRQVLGSLVLGSQATVVIYNLGLETEVTVRRGTQDCKLPLPFQGPPQLRVRPT